MNDFTYYSPTKFVFGRNALADVGNELSQLGFTKALVVYGQGSAIRSGLVDRIASSLVRSGIDMVMAGGVRPNPEVNWVRGAIETARENQVDGVIAIGGGSVIDAAKAVAFGIPHDGDVWEFFAEKLPIKACLPLAAVLTIPAAGSEASSSCVISNDAEQRKVGVNGDIFRPKAAFMDPQVTFTLPPFQTAAGVTDMIAHICERYFSGVGPVPVTDNIATGLVRALMDAAVRVIDDPRDYDARAAIMWAGMLAHNDLAGCGRNLNPAGRAGGWESHALEHELSAHHPAITHGAGLAVMMPAWMRYVWNADPQRFLDFGKAVFGIVPDGGGEPATDDAVEKAVLSAIDSLQAFFQRIGMPASLREFGLEPDEIDAFLGTLRQNKGERFGAFRPLDMQDARAIYESAF